MSNCLRENKLIHFNPEKLYALDHVIPIYKAFQTAEFTVHSTKKQFYKQSNGEASSQHQQDGEQIKSGEKEVRTYISRSLSLKLFLLYGNIWLLLNRKPAESTMPRKPENTWIC